MKITLFIFLSLFFLINIQAKNIKNISGCNCRTDLERDVKEQNNLMIQNYSKQGAYLKIGNESQILLGDDFKGAIILIHGFIASPFEVAEIAESLNENGYTVYMPLLYGFGSDGEMNNSGQLEIWRKQIRSAIDLLSPCFDKISIGGISLGGALATDYVLNASKKELTNIKSLMLFSPYYDVSQSVAKLLVGPLSNVKSSFDLTTLFGVSRSDDLVEILKNKKYYSDIMPFLTLQELFKLSDNLKSHQKDTKSTIPVFMAYSEFDTTINLQDAKSIPQKNFSKVNIFKLDKELKVPHQIGFSSSNPMFEKMLHKLKMHTFQSHLL